MARFQDGDRSAFDEIYALWAPHVQRYLEIALTETGTAEDATQQVFINVLRALPRYRTGDREPFEAWLFRIARNQALNELKARRAEAMDPRVLAAAREETEIDPGSLEWLTDPALAAHFDQLSRRKRQVVALRYAFGFGIAEIAKLLGLSPDHVGRLDRQARTQLRRAMQAGKGAAGRSDPVSSVRRTPVLPVLNARRRVLLTT